MAKKNFLLRALGMGSLNLDLEDQQCLISGKTDYRMPGKNKGQNDCGEEYIGHPLFRPAAPFSLEHKE